jgi:hypothetical protein
LRSSMRFGLVPLLIILALFSGIASTEQLKDEVNAISSLNQINTTGNTTQGSGAILNATNITDILNSTELKKVTTLENATMPKNVPIPENFSSKKSFKIIASANASDIKHLSKAIFVIDDGTTPIKRAGKIGQPSINGATLMRAVDGTPHGYTTYYN